MQSSRARDVPYIHLIVHCQRALQTLHNTGSRHHNIVPLAFAEF